MAKIIVNKHYNNSSAITETAFTQTSHAKGEIIVSNESENPGLYIIANDTSNPQGKVVKINSGDNVKLSSAYTESQAQGEALVVHSGDTVDVAIGKLSKQIKDSGGGSSMPNVGDGLEVVEISGEEVLKVKYDPNTLAIEEGRLKVIGEAPIVKTEWYGSESEFESLPEYIEGVTYYVWEDE